jgi:hypothetical protein
MHSPPLPGISKFLAAHALKCYYLDDYFSRATRGQMPTSGLKRLIELDAVMADALWACRLVMSLPRSPEILGVTTTFGTLNYLSLFRYESLKYLGQYWPDLAALLPQPTTDEVENSRNTIKLFDVHENVDGVIEHFIDNIATPHSQHFLGNTWLPLARLLEKDLGVTFYGGRIIYTTQSAAFILGVAPQILLTPTGGEYVKAASIRYGEHFGRFWDHESELGPSFVDRLDAKHVKMRDVRAAGYYGSHFNGSSTPDINALLFVFLATLNFLEVMLRLDDLPESRQTVFKMQFITLYHVKSSLQKLRNRRAADLSQLSLNFIQEAVSDATLDTITSGTSRHLRNTLIHYGIHASVQPSELDPDRPGYGLIEKYLPGHDYASLSAVVTEQIARVAKIFNAWV